MFTVTGGDWDDLLADDEIDFADTTSGSSSTWVRSTRRPTACCG